MADKYVHNNPPDPTEKRFERLEAQVVNIRCNMNLLMTALASKLRSFRDDGGLIEDGKSFIINTYKGK
jgi:hypothetical protein